jgi:ABC-type Mn2+/Zn2+ transport system permease subunit
MSEKRARATEEFRKMMKWIVLTAILMVVGGLLYSSWFTDLTPHLIVAVILGTFFSVVLGTGLFALAFFSDKSGHDDNVTDATRRRDGS